MNEQLVGHCKILGSKLYIELSKKQAEKEFVDWLNNTNKSDRETIRNNLRSYGWYIVKRRSGQYQLMERLTIKNAPEKFLESVFNEVKLCLENESDYEVNLGMYEVNLGMIEASMPAEIVRVKNVPNSLDDCVLMV